MRARQAQDTVALSYLWNCVRYEERTMLPAILAYPNCLFVSGTFSKFRIHLRCVALIHVDGDQVHRKLPYTLADLNLAQSSSGSFTVTSMTVTVIVVDLLTLSQGWFIESLVPVYRD